MRLILHTAAYWLMLDVRDCVPSWHPLRQSEFASIGLRLLKIAGRFVETASRIRVALASCCPEAELFSLVAFRLQSSGTEWWGMTAPGARTIHLQRVDSVLEPISLPDVPHRTDHLAQQTKEDSLLGRIRTAREWPRLGSDLFCDHFSGQVARSAWCSGGSSKNQC